MVFAVLFSLLTRTVSPRLGVLGFRKPGRPVFSDPVSPDHPIRRRAHGPRVIWSGSRRSAGLFLRSLVVALVAALGFTVPAAASPFCDRGEFCVWSGISFRGESGKFGIGSSAVGECIVLGRESRSLANLLRHDVTVYESPECATEADFTTYPGLGTYVPTTPFVVRAIQLWPA
ncbi:peptidase inhibitor family I36 protein [Actinokineospora globicatena]|uniref:Peptidase inhibitor family I36 n=1 Tax=Actinokineospora globicatena TaxID=103729 RepID=A0A9W6QQ62_9PSEU|nr:peptidase inhibitor family I36 protein [Actinokineospora globicatena]GLW92638.1 hypothetical protein Aglo03_34540 [Actinokineospora globicatena]